MTWSAPIERTMSTLLVLHTPVTFAPNDLAICTANVPTPPAAPLIKTIGPGGISPFSPKPPRRRPCNAVNPAIGTEAACSNVTFSGFRASFDSEAHAYSAKAPRHRPNTSSPDLNCVTFLPSASTWPATSTPGRLIFDLPSPSSNRRMNGPPFINFQSSGLRSEEHTSELQSRLHLVCRLML